MNISDENEVYNPETRDAFTKGIYKSLEILNSLLRVIKREEDINVKYGIQLSINELLMCINRRFEEENRSLREEIKNKLS